MMDKGLFKRLEVVSVFIFLAVGCARPVPYPSEPQPEANESSVVQPVSGQGRWAALKAELSSSRPIDGGILVISVRAPGLPAIAIQGKFEDIEIPFYPVSLDEFQGVLGVPFNHKPGPASVSLQVKGDEVVKLNLPFTIVDGNYRAEQLKVDQSHVTPNPKNLRRILREQKEIGKLYRRLTQKKYWDGKFLLPIESPITSPFGTKRTYNGEMKSFHQGLDLKAPVGTPIRVSAPGVVVLAKDLYLSGNTILVDHGYGVFTSYLHMSKMKVKAGKTVKAGELLGLSGMTGRVSGPHLHWGAIIHRSKVNPLDLTKVMR